MRKKTTKVTIVNVNSSNTVKMSDAHDINEENADEVLIEELEQAGLWKKNPRVKIAVKILLAKILDLQDKVDGALAILSKKE